MVKWIAARVKVSYSIEEEYVYASKGNLSKYTVRAYPVLTPNSDENEISLYVITTCSNIQVMRIEKVITKDKMSWYLDKFSLLVP